MNRTLKESLIVVLQGIAISVAELVPGVNGAAIAFISGIYEKIIDSINALKVKNFLVIFKKGPGEFWRLINGNFMLSLSIGILFSILTIARLILFLVTEFPVFIHSFFFGIIIASTIYILGDFKAWNFKIVFTMLIGTAIVILLTTLTPLSMTRESEFWLILATAVLASCVAYFPGISVSLVLILIGQYELVLKSFSLFKTDFIVLYLVGTIFGFFVFAKLFSWALRNYKNQSYAWLTGFMIGSLTKLWPWKHTLLEHTNQYAQTIPIKQEIVFPNAYYELTGKDPQTLYAILMAITGFLVIYLLHHAFSGKRPETVK